ncbi:HNH endonuclease [Kribbella sp. NPDC051718]|uniref:HNH endonuclease n=1 Tax=Kribbella sp. NPDC051718 TaxID=3155168 RepID=UPI0034192A3E
MSFDWSAITVQDVPQLPTRAARPSVAPIIEATCVNCEAQFGPPRCRTSPYCSVRCHDQAKYVRYARAKRREYGGNLPPDIRHALWVKRIHALGAGYDESARRISPARREAILERDGGRCVNCGKPADEIDHRDGSSAELSNLRLLCRPCHRRKTALRVVPIHDLSVLRDAEVLRSREEATVPLRACDSDDWTETWKD